MLQLALFFKKIFSSHTHTPIPHCGFVGILAKPKTYYAKEKFIILLFAF